MSGKCLVLSCDRVAEICGYCSECYERDITPYKYLTKQQLLAFIWSVQFILSHEFHLSLPREMIPECEDAYNKAQLRELYRGTKRFVDEHLRLEMFYAPYIREHPEFRIGGWEAWEKLCRVVAQALFGDVLIRPRLPNNTMPDIAPCVEGLYLEHTHIGSVRLLHAPLIIEVKMGIHHQKVLPKYSGYAEKVELWFYRWQPHWLDHREDGLIYQSPIELACRLDDKGVHDLASLLRGLPLLWRNYELLPHYIRGLASDD